MAIYRMPLVVPVRTVQTQIKHVSDDAKCQNRFVRLHSDLFASHFDFSLFHFLRTIPLLLVRVSTMMHFLSFSISSSLLLLALVGSPVHGWTTPPQSNSQAASAVSRRDALLQGIFVGGLASVGAASLLLAAQPANAAGVATLAELTKLQCGHARVTYLLKNWETLTSSCGSKAISGLEAKQVFRTEGGGGGICDKTPLRVQDFMGYKSTEDPLYRADKLMLRAAPLVADPDDAEKYLDAMERYRGKADQTAMMAYTSSWGEAKLNKG
jgi:hypothetical protein